MSHAQSTKLACSKCTWTGYFPKLVRVETIKKGDVTTVKITEFIEMCPECDEVIKKP